MATGSQQVKDRVKDGAQVGRAWPPTRPGGRQVRGDPGPGGVVEIGVVASGAHGSRNRADEPCFARGGSTSQTPSQTPGAAAMQVPTTINAHSSTVLSGSATTSVLWWLLAMTGLTRTGRVR